MWEWDKGVLLGCTKQQVYKEQVRTIAAVEFSACVVARVLCAKQVEGGWEGDFSRHDNIRVPTSSSQAV